MPERTRRWPRILLALTICLGLSAPSWGGVQHIPNGLSDFLGGVLPPPGFYWLNYLVYVQKDKFKDDDGSKVDGVDLDAGVFVDAARFVYMTPHKLFGATWGAQIIFPIYRAHVEVDVDGVGNVVDSKSSGIGDITINPIILAWHFSPNFHMGAGLDIVAPTGSWTATNPAAQLLNKNHWTFEPLVAISYWQPGGFDVSAKIMYDFHTKNDENPDGTLKPGQEFHFDWGVSYALGKEDLRLGAAGYCYWQTTDDKVGGDTIDDSRSRVYALGPALKWWPGMGRFSVTAKYLKEFSGRNVAEGQSFWINSVYAF